MRIRPLLLPAFLTLFAAALAWWILSVYEPVSPMQNPPGVTTQFSGEQSMQYLYMLTHRYKNRIMGSAQGFAAADYVAEQFRSIGLKVHVQDFRELGTKGIATTIGWFRGRNIIGVLPGRGLGTVVISAHRDGNPNSPEGAYDNGSGTAAVLELARVLVASSPHKYTYAFIALDGEENYGAGARVLMKNRPAALRDIRLMINLDVVGAKEKHELFVGATQYLSPEARAMAANHFSLSEFGLFEIPSLGPGGKYTDAIFYVHWGLPALSITDTRAFSLNIIHTPEDTYDKVSAASIQRVGKAVEQLILQGDAMGSFTPTEGLVVSNSSGFLSIWRYRLGGVCIFAIFALPVIFKFRPVINGARPVLTMAMLILLTWILASLSRVWFSSLHFIASPVLCTIAFLVLQAVALRWKNRSDSGLGRLLVTAAPSLLYLGTWVLLGFWSMGLLMAAVAYVPAVLVTWKSGWGWRLFDMALLLPTLLLAWFLAMAVWSLAPLQAFHPAKFPLLSALYMAIALIGIWGIFGRRPSHTSLIPSYDSHSGD